MRVRKNKGTLSVRMTEEVFLPVRMWRQAKALAKARGMTKSELIESILKKAMQ